MKSIVGLLSIVACLFVTEGRAETRPVIKKIVGGIDAIAADAPFIVSLRINGQHFCGGTLVDSRWVLTAAHCVDGITPDEIVAGSNKLSDTKAKRYGISRIVPHPNFNRNVEMSSDFALIKLSSKSDLPIAWLNRINPKFLALKQLTVAGWGDLEEGGASPDILQKLNVPVVSQTTCEKQLQAFSPSSSPILDNTMFCAGVPQGGKDSCQGDSGGPIFYKDSASGKYMLAGVVSWGFGCARADLSGIYADVSSSYRWVLNTMYQ